MARAAHRQHRTGGRGRDLRPALAMARAIGRVAFVVMAVALGTVSLAAVAASTGRAGPIDEHGTRPMRFTRADVVRIATAFGIDAPPERIQGGWEAEDAVRSLYLTRTPTAWYLQFDDASILLGPRADRDAICARAEPPYGCTVPGVEFVAAMESTAPDAATASRSAEAVLTRARLLPGRWQVVVLDPGSDTSPCRHDLDTEFDCTRQVLPTRSVMLSRQLRPGTTATRWGVIIAPDGSILSAIGRVAEPR